RHAERVALPTPDGITVEARQIILDVRRLSSIHPDVTEVPRPLEELHDPIFRLHDLHCSADPCERDQPCEAERLAAHLRIVAERGQHRAAVANVDVRASRRFLAAELEPARRPILLEPPLALGRHRRRLAEEAVARPRRRIAAFRARTEVVLLGRAAPEPSEIPLVVASRVRVRRADTARRRGLALLSRGAL